ncbi:ATP-binding protein [Methylobacterium marchantiae]|uniref:ATP-binding protein n=1 Tax=Methylobacterium marchantiae TaxID=600331 RepID=A0ABW3WUP1_9HYPH|nr:Chaperone protein HtpG [Methylobacterium marchantiae]
MTSADWLMITLSTYFHDLGLIVTEEEYQQRGASQFNDFCSNVLFGRDDGSDYKQKVDELGPDRAERFYYSEFVRYNHAARVKNWIHGIASTKLGSADTSAKELGQLLNRLSNDFRHDLGNICESHNLDDLQDLRKYKTFQPYGRTNDEACNLLYVAVLLRTTDLLQITKQRAPSVLHRFISPTDPISQVEWAKQNSVRGIFPKAILDTEGKATDEQPDTISVYAKFDNENGFFGLTSYLRYARSEIKKSYGLSAKAFPSLTRKYVFPWKEIDDSHVEANGFIPNPFEFRIDQAKILDLLTGHTLYNDSSVAVRELIQNSIDAVRLQCHIDQIDSREFGKIDITWDTNTLELKIIDNGTGMTQEVIERHFLSVGSSRYQEPKFKEQYPKFSPISRFGIGVLSAFMVADSVKIVTIHPDDEAGRQISLRSVHGKYLIRLLNKEIDPEAVAIGPHGTSVSIRMRPSSKKISILATINRWIVFPRCKMTLSINGGEPKSIGFDSPKQAIEAYIDSAPEFRGASAGSTVHEIIDSGLNLAFATKYNRHFRDSAFVQLSDESRRDPRFIAPLGLCVEGIRVQFPSPGFSSGAQILSIADCTGSSAPRTNVSRSALEESGDQQSIQELVYRLYFKQVEHEIDRLQKDEGFSLSYAVEQFPFVASALLHTPTDEPTKRDVLRKFPLFIVENGNNREQISAHALAESGEFWTVESKTLSALMELLRDTKADVTARQVSEFCAFRGSALPSGRILTNATSSIISRGVLETEFEVCELRASETDRRLDARWRPIGVKKAWISGDEAQEALSASVRLDYNRSRRMRQRRRSFNNGSLLVAVDDVPLSGLDRYFAVSLGSRIYILPGTPLQKYLIKFATSDQINDIRAFSVYCEALFAPNDYRAAGQPSTVREVESYIRDINARSDEDHNLEVNEFLSAIESSSDKLALFNPFAWNRSESNGDHTEYE